MNELQIALCIFMSVSFFVYGIMETEVFPLIDRLAYEWGITYKNAASLTLCYDSSVQVIRLGNIKYRMLREL